MKKFLFLSLFSFVCLWSITCAQTSGMKEVTTQISTAALNQAGSAVQSIEVSFCDTDAKNKTFSIHDGQTQDLCLQFTNNDNKSIAISVDFVDGTFTNDQRKNRACLDKDQKTNFGQYVTGMDSSLVLPATSSITKHASIQYPKGMHGTFNGCLVYYGQWSSNTWTTDFNIVISRAKFIDVNVSLTLREKYRSEAIILLIVIILALLVKWKFSSRKKESS